MRFSAGRNVGNSLLQPSVRRKTRPGEGLVGPPPLTRLLGYVATRGKRHSKERQKSLLNCFGHFLGQVKGQVTSDQMPQKVKFCHFQHFSTNGHMIRQQEELKRRGKAHSVALLSFNALSLGVLRFDLRLTFGLQRETTKNSSFGKKLQ